MDFAQTDWSAKKSQGEPLALFTNKKNGCNITVTVNHYRQQVQSMTVVPTVFTGKLEWIVSAYMNHGKTVGLELTNVLYGFARKMFSWTPVTHDHIVIFNIAQ